MGHRTQMTPRLVHLSADYDNHDHSELTVGELATAVTITQQQHSRMHQLLMSMLA